MIARILATLALPLSLASGAAAQAPAPPQPSAPAELPFIGTVSAAEP